MTRLMRKFSAYFVILACCAALFGATQTLFAAGLLPDPHGKCPENYEKGTTADLKTPCANGEQRDYSLDDTKLLIGRIGNWMLGFTGTIVLFAFVVGGFMWLLSAGNSGLVSKGQSIMKSAVIGLIIVFFAYTAITYGVRILLGNKEAVKYLPKAAGSSFDPNAAPAYTVSTNKSAFDKTQLCANVLGGACVTKGACKAGTAVIGACPKNGDCCVTTKNPEQDGACGQLGGTCQKTSAACGGAYVKNMCVSGSDAGDANQQCCFGSGS